MLLILNWHCRIFQTFFAEHQVYTDILLTHQRLKISILNTLELTCKKMLSHVLGQEFGMRYPKE